MNLAISGCHGRMGQSIIRLAREDSEFKLSACLEHKDHPKVNEAIDGIDVSTTPDAIKGSDILIEFTSPEATIKHLEACVENNVKMVIGTTGLQPEHIDKIKDASEKIAIVFSSNMSVGVNLLFKLTQMAGEITGENYKISIVEAHHVHKKDAPSGTAKTIAQIAQDASGQKIEDIESIREGEIIGDHTISFESNVDTLSLSHHAKTRDIFAEGALVAAKFLSNKESGLYNMQDVLGLN